MIKEQFLKLLNLNTAERHRKLMSNLYVILFPKKKKVVGVRFRSDVQYRADSYLDASRRVVCLWLVTLLRDHFKEETDVIIRPAVGRQPKDGEIWHDEGIIVEVLLNDIEFSESKDKDAIIEKFGKSLVQFIDKTFENEEDAEESLGKFNDENRDVVQDYVKRRLETGEIRFPENRIIKLKQEEGTMNNQIIKLLIANFNVILTGAPGTGKTYLARQVARSIVLSEEEEKLSDEKKEELFKSRISFVQFHPSYDYTDFVEGLRPIQGPEGEVGFKRQDGEFKALCKRAIAADCGGDNFDEVRQKFVMIIDEINRGDISKIFGELFYAIDLGYRGEAGRVKTQYQNLVEKDDPFYDGFYVPENVYVIGTMNDIDRSVESMDFAIRRRFTWYEVKPDSKVLDSAENGKTMISEESDRVEARKRMDNLNGAIEKENLLGAAYAIGPAYFLKLDKVGGFEKLWELNLEPLLREYLRGNPTDEIKKKIEVLKNAYYDKEPPKAAKTGSGGEEE